MLVGATELLYQLRRETKQQQQQQQCAMQAPSAAAEPDGEGRQFLAVQRHAAAVQLLGRSLAVAHLRAQAAMPK